MGISQEFVRTGGLASGLPEWDSQVENCRPQSATAHISPGKVTNCPGSRSTSSRRTMSRPRICTKLLSVWHRGKVIIVGTRFCTVPVALGLIHLKNPTDSLLKMAVCSGRLRFSYGSAGYPPWPELINSQVFPEKIWLL